MAKINADILIQDSLYEQISALVEEMQISQSELFTIAIEDYVQRDRLRRVAHHRNHKLLQSINEAYEDGLDGSESGILEGMRRHQRHLIEK
jgi:metal-responsive CopG/Arc/MetJ family transcriptional regulator